MLEKIYSDGETSAEEKSGSAHKQRYERTEKSKTQKSVDEVDVVRDGFLNRVSKPRPFEKGRLS
jgi:hypothetical protein